MDNTIDYIELGKTIKTIRSEKNLTQEKLAELTNMSTTHISNIENGKTKVSLSAIFSISNALNYTIDGLICGDICNFKNETPSYLEFLMRFSNHYEKAIISETVEALINSLIKNRKRL